MSVCLTLVGKRPPARQTGINLKNLLDTLIIYVFYINYFPSSVSKYSFIEFSILVFIHRRIDLLQKAIYCIILAVVYTVTY